MPLEIEPPSPLPAPPLRKRPSIIPQFSSNEPSAPRLFIDQRWN
ncbi:MAG: hypothetical protein NWE93_10385 [Candidatus Bathyarchaeota archaeon]|nr:hypothetical protein [Candidatus Bathyarchaeota archaeon]